MQKVFYGFEALGRQHRRPAGANAVDGCKGCIQLEWQIRV
jgi:hypothetical protein